MRFAVDIYNMSGKGFDVVEGAVLRYSDVAVAHQDDVLTIDVDDAMHHITGAINPGEYHQAFPQLLRLLKDDTLTSADDKRSHAVSLDRKRDAHPLVHQSDGFLYDDLVTYHHPLLSFHDTTVQLLRRADMPDAK